MYYLNTIAGKKKCVFYFPNSCFEQPGSARGHLGKDGFLLRGSHVLLEFRADMTLILFRFLKLSVSKKKFRIGFVWKLFIWWVLLHPNQAPYYSMGIAVFCAVGLFMDICCTQQVD